MHEMAMVRNLVDVVLQECDRLDVAAVQSVHLSIGELMDVIEQYVPGLFRYLAKDSVAQDAEVVIERIPAHMRCETCGDIFPFDPHAKTALRCPSCAGQCYRLFSGREFRVDSIDIVEKVGAAPASETPRMYA